MNLPFAKLPIWFDPAGLRTDLESIASDSWLPHLSEFVHAGACTAVAMRSRGGTSDDLAAWGPAREFRNTPLAAQCPHIMAGVDTFELAKKSVHLVRLGAGARLREFRAVELGIAPGELRIHVPVVTGNDVELIAADRCLTAREGEAWCIAPAQTCRMINRGIDGCVFLVIDGVVNDWAHALLQRAAQEIVGACSEPVGAASFRAFRDRVFDHPALQARLADITRPDQFFEAVVTAGTELGFAFDSIDVESALNRSRHDWMMRTVAL